jgi:putative inorganic carbon (hco3(-)) transporter
MPANLAILAVGVIGAPLLFFLAWRRPTIALTVWLISSVVFSEYILLPDAPILHVHLSRLLLAALLSGLVAGWIPERNTRTTSAHPELLIMALTLWTIVSACWAGTMFRVDGTRNASVFLTGFLLPGMILYLARSFPLSLKTSRSICALLTLLLGYLVFTAFCEHFHLDSLVFPQYILDPSLGIHTERARGPIVNAAENGGIIAILLLVALHAILYSNTGVIRWATCLGLLLLGIPALWFTETRGPWVAFAGGLLVMLWHKQGRGLVLSLGGASVVVLGAFLIYLGVSAGDMTKKDPLPQRSDNTSDTVDFRIDLYRESLGPFEDHPLVGWGLGTFTDTDHLFDAYGSSLTLSTAVLHDTIFAITLESGIIGGALYVAFLTTVSVALIRLRRASPSFERRDFYTLCLASLAAFVINGVFVDIRYFMPQNALVFLMAGLGLSLRPTDRPQPEEFKAASHETNLRLDSKPSALVYPA